LRVHFRIVPHKPATKIGLDRAGGNGENG
jgi:hypothetical protein